MEKKMRNVNESKSMKVKVEVEKSQRKKWGGVKNGEQLAKDEGKQEVLRATGNTEQVRRTIAQHWFLALGQRIMGYGTRHKGHIRSKHRDVVWDLGRLKMGRRDGWLG